MPTLRAGRGARGRPLRGPRGVAAAPAAPSPSGASARPQPAETPQSCHILQGGEQPPAKCEQGGSHPVWDITPLTSPSSPANLSPSSPSSLPPSSLPPPLRFLESCIGVAGSATAVRLLEPPMCAGRGGCEISPRTRRGTPAPPGFFGGFAVSGELCPPPAAGLRGWRSRESETWIWQPAVPGRFILGPHRLGGYRGEPTVPRNKKRRGKLIGTGSLRRQARSGFNLVAGRKQKRSCHLCLCVPIRGPPGSLLAYREGKKKKKKKRV